MNWGSELSGSWKLCALTVLFGGVLRGRMPTAQTQGRLFLFAVSLFPDRRFLPPPVGCAKLLIVLRDRDGCVTAWGIRRDSRHAHPGNASVNLPLWLLHATAWPALVILSTMLKPCVISFNYFHRDACIHIYQVHTRYTPDSTSHITPRSYVRGPRTPPRPTPETKSMNSTLSSSVCKN